MKKNKVLNYMLLMISVSLTILLIPFDRATASSVTALKGNDAIKDISNNMVYYKSGVVSKSTGTVNLIKKDKKTGVKKILTKVDINPFYLHDNYIYYTTNKGINRIKTDGTNKKQLASLATKTSKQQILGIDGKYIYYSDFIYGEDSNKMVISRSNVNGTNQHKVREYEYYSYETPVLTKNKIYYVTNTTDHKKSLTSTTLDGKTTKNVIKGVNKIFEIKGNSNGLFFVYQKESTSDYVISKIDNSGLMTNLVTIENALYPYISFIKLSCFEDDYLYYTLNSQIYQVSYDGIEQKLLYDTKNINNYNDPIAEICIKGDWMIIRMDNDGSYSTYCVKKDGFYELSLGSQCYSNSYDILGNTIYYRVVTIPGDDEDFTYNDENVYRKFTLPLKEYE